MKTETKCVHAGTLHDKVGRGLNTPIFPSSAHEYLDGGDVPYPRYFNTMNQKVIVEKLCALEGAESGLVFSSGMAAISSTLLAFLKSGDHAVIQNEIYGGSHSFITSFFDRVGISYTFVATDTEAISAAMRPETKVLFIETPTNPLLGIIDIREAARIAADNKVISIIDNTFATPINQLPMEMGIDVVIHSGTKYLGGHSDLSSGAVLTNSSLVRRIQKTALNLGGNLNAIDCYLLERSLKTLSLRVGRQTENAQTMAEFLAGSRYVSRVNYPGLPDHPDHELAGKQMSGFGAMLSFEMVDGITVDDFMRKLKIIRPAVSLGGIETTICDPARTSHSKMSAEERARQGISDNLLRLSVGIESFDDLFDDIRQAAQQE
jgi:cystathionine beta-lyase